MPNQSQRNYQLFSDLLREKKPAQVLVVGGRVWGEGMDALREPHLHLVQTDIEHGPHTQVVCDEQTRKMELFLQLLKQI